ncbi:hypothetical protein ACO0LG_10025 [Undibacterium sp. Ji42W]|uniref:hypothetical protein n=1 Tax=Undibacterium sp. Ji42W TaxID=3413039 RepID=UPI003BF18ED9
MKTTADEQDAISHANANAAIDAAFALLKTDREAVRAAHWNRLSIAVRRIAVMSANLPKERADDTLNKFTALERGKINVAMRRLMNEMEVISKCMQGGSLPGVCEVHH